MTPPPSLHHFLLIAFLILLDSELYGGRLLPTVVASESLDNGTTKEVDIPSSDAENADTVSLLRRGDPFPTSDLSIRNNELTTPPPIIPHNYSNTLNTTTTHNAPPTPTDNTCIAQKTCETCNSYTCHWCAFDSHCHAKASIHGCTIGTNCHTKNDTKPDDNHDDDPVDKSCQSHPSCTDCVLSSNLCHWCAFDDACHAIGSWYGCAHGTDCYANDRCQREKAEPQEFRVFSDIGWVPIVLICSIGVCTFFCSSVVYSGVRALKGAYEDLAGGGEVVLGGDEVVPGVRVERDYSGDVVRLQLDDEVEEEINNNNNNNNDNNEVTKGDVDIEILTNSEADEITEVNNSIDTESQNLLPEQHHTPPPIVTAHPDPSRLPRRRAAGSQNIKCLLTLCHAWYIFTILGTILFVTLSFYCFPRMPQYNVCSDELAWKSIIAGLTSLKMEASFELLLSIENKNHLTIDLEGFAGKISHDGGEVGSFELPQSTILASSITDVLVTCTVVPNKWEALGLVAEYYKGELILTMSVNGSVKVTGIDYSFPVKETDVVVRVNDPSMDDRHLCACPEWKDMYPTSSPITPEFLIDSDPQSAVTIF